MLRFAESQGIEIPAEEDSGMDEQGVNATLSSENDELAAALQAATSSFGADLLAQSGASHEIGADDLSSTTDSLGLKKLIEDSLSKEISAAMPTSQETGGAASSGGGSGLLSLINEKIGQNSANLATASPYQTSVPANACEYFAFVGGVYYRLTLVHSCTRSKRICVALCTVSIFAAFRWLPDHSISSPAARGQ